MTAWSADTLVINAGRLLTLAAGGDGPRTGDTMRRVGTIENGAVAIRGGRVLGIGTTDRILRRHKSFEEIIDAEERLVMPGFVDCHTHAVFAGSREAEMAMRLGGTAYLDILKSGGGIHETVTKTRRAGASTLVQLGMERLSRMAAHGTTTVEIKSGYGLDLPTEKELLNVIRALDERHPVDVAATYLGAHALPAGRDREAFIDEIECTLPDVAPFAEFFDVFCEDGAFTAEEALRLLAAAARAGLGLKVHAGQFNDLGAAGRAAELGAVSCDHLEAVSDEQLAIMAARGTVAVLLPGAPFFLKTGVFPDGRRIIDAGVPVALATDFNPGSCPCFSIQMIIALAVLECGLTAEEALVAATVNGAFALNRGDIVGSLAPGRQADIIILNVETPGQIPYYFGGNLVHRVIKKGEVIH